MVICGANAKAVLKYQSMPTNLMWQSLFVGSVVATTMYMTIIYVRCEASYRYSRQLACTTQVIVPDKKF